MSRNSFASVVVLALVALLAIGEAIAQVRMPPAQRQNRDHAQKVDEATAREQKLAEMDAWLRRLVGRYRYSGSVTLVPWCDEIGMRVAGVICRRPGPAQVEGMGDCLGFGTGPGVQCVINVTWQRLNWNAVGNGPWSPTLAPAMILYGVDPDELGIRYLQVDNLGIADSALGSLNGDTVVFRMSCVNQDADMRSCTRDVRMSVSPDGRTIRMAIDVTFRPSMLVLDLKVNIRLLLERLQQMEPE